MPHIGPLEDQQTDRDTFTGPELAMVMSHYEVGVIENIREFQRGSRRSPKARISSRQGQFLLKRRAPGRDDPFRVAFAHHLQLHLAERGFPVAALVGTKDTHNSLVQRNGRIYELFEFVKGVRYNESPAETRQAGRSLGRLHRLLADHEPTYAPPGGSYHAAPGLDAAITTLPEAVARVDQAVDKAALKKTCTFLRKAYNEAVKRVDKCGYAQWPIGVMHGDWHPGNLLFRDGQVVAALDFDSARLGPRMADVANAMLQFSMRMSDHDPGKWPEGLDSERLRAMLEGYHEASGQRLSDAELDAAPWLIVEALVMESVVPIAATGSFGRVSGAAFLSMIERNVRWTVPRVRKIVRFLKGES